MTKKVLANYYFLVVVSFVLLLTVCFAWFVTNKEATAQAISLTSYSNQLTLKGLKVSKNGVEIANHNNIFYGLVPGDVLTFDISVHKEVQQDITIELGMQGITSEYFMDANNTNHLVTDMFQITYGTNTQLLSAHTPDGNLILNDAIIWQGTADIPLKATLTFAKELSKFDGNLYAKKGFQIKGFYVRQKG